MEVLIVVEVSWEVSPTIRVWLVEQEAGPSLSIIHLHRNIDNEYKS